MISQIFKTGGGAGIGSYVLVIKDGELLNPNAEKIRWSYDSGENLFLSILDDSTQEALLPLTGYVDNEGILHLFGRDFDDNKTYEFTIGGENHEVNSEVVDGIVLGDGTIGENANFKVYEYDLIIYEDQGDPEILTQEQMVDIWENQYDVVKVNVIMRDDPGSYDPGSYEPGSYDPSETHMTMNFLKSQYVENMLVSYSTSVNIEKDITMLTIFKDGDEFEYELDETEVGGGSYQEEVHCGSLYTNNDAHINQTLYVGTASLNETELNDIKNSSGGTQLYKHYLGYESIPDTNYSFYFYIISNIADPITNLNELETHMRTMSGICCARARDNTDNTNAIVHLYADFGKLFISIPDGTVLEFSSWDFSGGDIITAL